MMQPSPDEKSTKIPNFPLFIEEKLSSLSKRNRMVTEKRIMDVVFEIEMSTFKENEHEGMAFSSCAAAPMLMPTQNPNLLY